MEARGRYDVSRLTRIIFYNITAEHNSTSVFCDGCDIVQSDHAPEAGVAQGIFHGDLIRHQGRNQEEVEEGLEDEVERHKEEDNQEQVRMPMTMDGNEDTQTRLEPHVTHERMYDNTSKRRASCSVVRSCHVRVSHGAHVIVHNVLRIVEVVREDIRSIP